LVAYYFKIFSPIAVLANIFIVPLAAFVTLSGFAFLFSAFALPFLCGHIGRCCEMIIVAMVKINAFLVEVPGACFRLG